MRTKRSRASAIVTALLFFSGLTVPTSAGADEFSTAPYIVEFKSEFSSSLQTDLAKNLNLEVLSRYSKAINGLSANLTAVQVRALRSNPRVLSVQPDSLVKALATQNRPPSWGLDRIDQRDLPLSQSYTYQNNPGASVDVYVFDTGIRTSHFDFSGRIRSGFSAISDGRGVSDCDGHGTHVSGTIAGTTYGVAKSATIIPVRVLGCDGSGSLSGLLRAVDWVINNHTSNKAVANMSLGFDSSIDQMTTAINNLAADGILTVVAAGNDGEDACTVSPASAPAALTIGATDNTDTRTSWSNYGSCVDLFAPGSRILSTWNTFNTSTANLSGTSMASPHVAGIAAVMLSSRSYFPNLTNVQDLSTAITNAATPSKVREAGANSPTTLAYLPNADGGPITSPPPPPPSSVKAPSAPTNIRVTTAASGVTVTWTAGADNGSAVVSQTLMFYSSFSSHPSRTVVLAGGLTSATLVSLTPGSLGRVGIQATNAIGSSPIAYSGYFVVR